MIVEMSRVLVVGPKRLLAPALEELQLAGTLHVDRVEAEEAPEGTAALPEADRAEREHLERLRLRVDGLLSLLPALPVEPPPTDPLAALPTDALEGELSGVESQVQGLVRARGEAQDELELIGTYESAVRVLAPLLGALAGSRAFETIGFILRTRDLSIVQDFRRRLGELTGGRIEVVSRMVEEDRVGVVVAFHRRDEEAVRGFLARAGVSELRLPSQYADLPPADAIRTMEERRRALPAELDRIGAELRRVSSSERARLVALRAVVQDRLARLRVVPQLAQSRYTFIVHGWSPTRSVAAIRHRLRQRFGEELVVYDTPADPHEAERVPVLLDNPGPIRPFQLLLAPFRPPRYGTMDPSPLFALTFPLFVGLVIGDVGYGALFFLLGWWLRNRARRDQGLAFLGMRMTPTQLRAISWVVRVLAVWIIAFGVLYAEVFGNLPELFFHVHPPFNRLEERDLYFRIIILIGIVMIYLGLLGHLRLAVTHRHVRGIFESLVMMLFTSAVLIFLGAQVDLLPRSVAPWAGYLLLATIFAIALYGVVSRRPAGALGSAMWILESFTAFGHILSHARLMAFGLAAAALALAANELGPEMIRTFGVPGIIGAIFATLLAAVFQGLFFVFTIIGHLIQPARLHWVEFLSKVKYFEETGQQYRPFQRAGGG